MSDDAGRALGRTAQRPGKPQGKPRAGHAPNGGQLFAALDLGTNNCRLLVATRTNQSFRVVDAFSRIVRLGEGLGESGALSPLAMERAMAALQVCADKVARRRVTTVRCVATQACRYAKNGSAFVSRVADETGLQLDVITPQEEARLAVMGCLSLIDRQADAALVVDIGGGSTELSWVDVAELRLREAGGRGMRPPIVAWASIPIGVVTLAERFPERTDRCAWYAEMLDYAAGMLVRPPEAERLADVFAQGRAHVVGTSGTVTSLAGVHLRLPRYERCKVDGLWVTLDEALTASRRLQAMCAQQRAAEPCIGPDRADLVLAGCAILEAVTDAWPSGRLRVADRGLREGVLMTLMHAPKRRRRRGGRSGRRGPAQPQAQPSKTAT